MLKIRFKNGEQIIVDANHFDYDNMGNILLINLSGVNDENKEFRACVSSNEFLSIENVKEKEENDD